MVKPILLYASEIWSLFNWRSNTKNCILHSLLHMKHKFESLHTKACRNALGVHKHASEFMVKAELGRYPLSMNILCNIYKYWQHILHSKDHSLVAECLRWALQNHIFGHENFVTKITSLFHAIDLPDVLTSATESSQRSNKIKIINKFKLIHQHYFNNILNDKTKSGEEGRFTVYSKIKRNFIYEKYLSMDNNILRRHITSIRISTHSLPVELLRKSGVKREDRNCTLCASNKIATEYHALLECEHPKIKHERSKLFSIITNKTPHFQQLNNSDKFTYMCLAIDPTTSFHFAIFLGKIFNIYKES